MSAATASPQPVEGHRAITIAALLATYMQAANISLPNAALPHIQGTLSMADDEVGWVFNAYIAASVITMPLTRWLAGRYGRKTVFLYSLAIFTVGLMLVTLSTNPIQFVLARILQGAASGPLAPLSLAIALDVLPPPRHARISLMLAACVLFGISSGPPVGGWLSEYHGWTSIFYFSLPLVGFIFLAMGLTLQEKRAEQPPAFDFFGWASFSLGIAGLQMVLDRGERLEWFDSAEIWAEAAVSAVGFYFFIVHVLTSEVHFFNKALFRDRNFALSTIMCFAMGFALLPTLALTSPMLEELLNYPVDTTGYMAIPRGVALVGSLVVVSLMPARFDFRLFVISGFALVVFANWLMLGYSPLMDWRPVVIAGVLQGAGLGTLVPALTKAAFSTLDPKFRPEGTALFTLIRLYGSTIGIAVVQLFFYNNIQAMHLALAKDLSPFRAAANVAGTVAKPGLAMLNDMVTGQAGVISVIDQFEIMMFVVLVASPLVLFLRRPRPVN